MVKYYVPFSQDVWFLISNMSLLSKFCPVLFFGGSASSADRPSLQKSELNLLISDDLAGVLRFLLNGSNSALVLAFPRFIGNAGPSIKTTKHHSWASNTGTSRQITRCRKLDELNHW